MTVQSSILRPIAARLPVAPRMPNRREDAIAFLLSRINYERVSVLPYSERTLKLARMRELYDRLGKPAAGTPVIHIAGTKGKGSTAAMIASILASANFRTGLFSSPHLDQIEERFCVNGIPCDGEALADMVDHLRPIVASMDAEAGESDGGPTYFELTTAIAMMLFADRKVDAIVLEVGLGGRLDSTNICDPTLCVITSISLDHTKQLGDSLSSIAREKAGIIKHGAPVVCGVREKTPRSVIAQIAQNRNAQLVQIGVDFDFKYNLPKQFDSLDSGRLDYFQSVSSRESLASADRNAPTSNGELLAGKPTYERLPIPLLGRHQAANAAVAVAAMQELARQGWAIGEDAIRRGLSAVRLPARIEIVRRRPTVIVDAAHNIASAQALVEVLRTVPVTVQKTLLLAATVDKDVPGILRELLPHFDRVVLTQYQNNPRAMSVEDLADIVRSVQQEMLANHEETRSTTNSTAMPIICSTPKDAWQVVEEAAGEDELICATGSFFIAAEIRRFVLESC